MKNLRMKMQGPILGWIGNGFRMVAEDPAGKQTSYIHPVMRLVNIYIGLIHANSSK